MADPKSASVCIAWVHPHEVAYSWAISMMEMQGRMMSDGRTGRYLAIRYGSGGISNARNRAARKFLDEQDEEWLFWIDTDMGFAPDLVDQLLESADADERPVVGALCFAQREVRPDGVGGFDTFPVPTIYRWAQQPDGSVGFVSWHEYPRDDMYQCEGTGSAAILIHRSVFERIRDEFGDTWYTGIANPKPGADPFSEDLSFCLRLREIGVPLWVNTAAKTTHLKPVWVGQDSHDLAYAAAMSVGERASDPTGEAPKPNRAQRRAASKK